MRLVLVDINAAVCEALDRCFAAFEDASVVLGGFEDLERFDCMVSPGNSFGLMDGGVDLAIITRFGVELQRRVQRRILDDYLGEQPVGTSFLVETGDPRHRYLAHTPTMRVPMRIAGRDNVYVAMWAMLLAVRAFNRERVDVIETVACPGLGTGTGGVPADQAARQMALAYDHFLSPPVGIDWPHARARQDALATTMR